jgi:hypothetical protein
MWYNLLTMEGESRWKIWQYISTKTAEVTPEEKARQEEAEARQNVVKFLKDASPLRLEVFDDYTTLQLETGEFPPSFYDRSVIEPLKIKLLQKLPSGVDKGDRKYSREFRKVEVLGEAYKKAVRDRLGSPSVNHFRVKRTAAEEFQEIKAEELNRRNQ